MIISKYEQQCRKSKQERRDDDLFSGLMGGYISNFENENGERFSHCQIKNYTSSDIFLWPGILCYIRQDKLDPREERTSLRYHELECSYLSVLPARCMSNLQLSYV